MKYDKRNRTALDTLAPNTKAAAYKFYQYCIDNNIEILITEGIRTLETQQKYVAEGKSQTLKSYHLVGQAFDFVPLDTAGNLNWNASGYKDTKVYAAIQYAKSIGFEWGGEWKTFIDMPHLQFNYKGYGTDKALEVVKDYMSKGDKGDSVKALQEKLNVLGYNLTVDGDFGSATDAAVRKVEGYADLVVDGQVNAEFITALDKAIAEKEQKDRMSKYFNDLEKTHWACEILECLYEKGVITGDQNGNVNPDLPVTKAQVGAMIYNLLKYLEK